MQMRNTHVNQRGVIAATGIDRHRFLQGMLTQDMQPVTKGLAIYAALLTPQGKFLHDLFVIERGDTVWLDCEAARTDDLVQRLRKYVLRSTVTFEDITSTHGVAVIAPDAGAPQNPEGVATFQDPRLPELGWRCIGPRELLPEQSAEAETAWDALRLQLGVPDGSRDMAPGQSLVLEFNLDRLNAISFTKGCYIGQELTARIHHRALLKRRACPMRCTSGPCPPPGTPLLLDGEVVGEMRSSYGSAGLALLRTDVLAALKGVKAEAATLTPYQPFWFNLENGSLSAN